MIVPPNLWFHQHFNTGTTPARYLAFKAEGVAIRNAQGVPKAWISRRLGGDQIDYADESPRVRQVVRRMRWRGAVSTSRMDEGLRGRAGRAARLRRTGVCMKNVVSCCRESRLAERVVLAAAGCGSPAPVATVTAADLALYEGADRLQRLIEGAKQEGELTIYTSAQTTDLGPVVEAFEKKYGIKASIWRAGSEAVLNRALQESRAGRHTVDIVETNGPELEVAVARADPAGRQEPASRGSDRARDSAARRMGGHPAERVRAGLQHEARQERGAAEDLGGPGATRSGKGSSASSRKTPTGWPASSARSARESAARCSRRSSPRTASPCGKGTRF